jgi:hypothetical protein
MINSRKLTCISRPRCCWLNIHHHSTRNICIAIEAICTPSSAKRINK